MSTKTTFKRIALVTVAALGFGVLTSVAPASAASERTAASITAGASSAARAGAVVTTPVVVGFAADLVDSDTITVAAKVISAPATSKHTTATSTINAVSGGAAAVLTFASSTSLGSTSSTNTDQSAASFGAYTTAVSAVVTNVGSSGNLTKSLGANLLFTPDLPGTYQIMVSSGVGNTSFVSGNVSAIITITTAGTPASVTLSNVTGSAATGGEGAILKAVVKDAAGVATTLLPGEGVTVASSVTTTAMTVMTSVTSNTASSGTADSVSLTNSNFINGAAYIRATDSAEETVIFTATSNGTLGSSLVNTLSVAYTAPTLVTGSAATLSKPTTATSGYLAGAAATPYVVYTQPKTATSSTIQLNYDNSATSVTTAAVGALQVTDTSGKITGIAGAVFDVAVSVAAGATKGSITFSHSLSTAGQGYSAILRTVTSAAGTGFALTSGTSDATATSAAAAVIGGTTVLAATGGTTTWKVSVKDQYGVLKASTPVTLTITGRNAAKSGAVAVSDATGYATFTLTDAGTVGSSDSLSFSAGGSATAATATVTYGTYTVGSVTLTGGSDLETIAGSTITAISAGDDPSTNARKAFKATVKDANGNLLAGVPVTFAVSGNATSAIVKSATVDYTTVYTGTDGTATSYAFAWGPGKMTVTATSGEKSGTQYLTFGSAAASAARVLSATVSGTTVTVKVVDRYGNPVDGVTVNLTRTGTGTFGNGSSSQDVKTDTTGTAEAQFSGAADVKAKLAATYTQAYDLAGEIDATAVTAAVAGTTTGTGSTLAPAGVYQISVRVDATSADTAAQAVDAAAEATDAANAATDAANAAAEAADAATAAAQDAADAVAALSTQVTEMVSALKKQITALTNLVIKIQKKVKA